MSVLRFIVIISLFALMPSKAFLEEVGGSKVGGESPAFLLEMKKPDGTEGYPGIGRVIISLLLVFFIVIAVVFALKKMGYGNNKLFLDSTLIKLLASKKLSVKSMMHLVDIEGVQYVVVEKENAISIVRHSTENKLEQES